MPKQFYKKRFSFGFVVASVVLGLVICILSTIAYGIKQGKDSAEKVAAARALPIYSVETDEKKLSISFDCAWGVEHTDELLEVMKANDVRCTFFAVEFWVEKYPEYVEKIIAAGHEMGTHSRTHPYMSKLTEAEIRDELSTSASAIERLTGQKVTLFRPPYGDYNNTLINVSNSMGLYPIQWDVDSLDWKNLSATEIALRVVNGAKNGSIILCHNNGLHTAKALPLIFSTLKNRGFTFVPISELIHKENYTIDRNGRQHAAS
ncbi:MAG: polysaccharide deacetylase family protein [Clostridia bacterium]|nr:polysaccharide deacetylase family protein [Clostridia bacterium]MBQ9714754.1 polysaccharide deacetylase family protein [Clostridia bacterium]